MEWDLARLDNIASRETGHTPEKDVPEYWDGGVKWVSLADSGRLDSRWIHETAKKISALGIENSSARLLPKGTVILLRDASIGRVGLLGADMAVSQHFVAWICSGDLNNEFLYYWLLSRRRLFERMGGGTTIATIGMPFFSRLVVPVPPLQEQRKIASILSTCDDVIERTRELIAAKREQKKGLMQQLLTGKRRLRGYRDRWSQRSLGELAEDVARRNNGKLGKDRLYAVTKAEGLVPMRAHVMGESVERCKVVERDWFAYNPMRINVGSLALWEGPDEVMVSGDYVVFRCFDRKLAPPYFNHLRRTGRWEHFVRNSGNGSVRIRLYFDDIAEFRFPCPGIDEQRAIASVLTAADAEIAALERKLTALREQKRGLMQQLLTGAIRVGVGR